MSMTTTRRDEDWTERMPGALLMVATVLVVAWVVEIVDTALGGALDAYGIRPRTAEGLEGIPVSPFLHAGFGHLLSNSVIFAILGVVTFAAVSLLRFVGLVLITTLTSGLGAWAFGAAGSVVVGGSGVIFGLLGFLLLRGIAERSPGSIAVSVVVLVLYGSAVLGVVPGDPAISWQAHLFGFLGGAAAAFLLRSRGLRRARRARPGPPRHPWDARS